VEIDTSIAAMEVRRRLEDEIVQFIQHNGLMRFTTPERLSEHLVKLGKLLDGDRALFRKLREFATQSSTLRIRLEQRQCGRLTRGS
jgi:actin-like ATPase involved in cell morphogenesis